MGGKIDPKMNNTSAKAHEWLPVLPGTDGALALGIAHVMLTEGIWYKGFVGDFKDGTNRFKSGQEVDETTFEEKESHGVVKWWNIAVKDMTPQKAAELSGVSSAQIIRIARGMGKAAPKVCVWMGPGCAMHVRGAYSAMAVHALAGLTGGTDSEGGSLQTAKIPVNKLNKDRSKIHTVVKRDGIVIQRIEEEMSFIFCYNIKEWRKNGRLDNNSVSFLCKC